MTNGGNSRWVVCGDELSDCLARSVPSCSGEADEADAGKADANDRAKPDAKIPFIANQYNAQYEEPGE